jgi:hypothetical protein
MIKQFLIDIINYSELTVCRGNICWLNKYKSNWKKIDYNVALCLIQSNVIEIDSGNFETGETHYILNFRGNRLSRIDYLIKNVNSYYYNGEKIIHELKLLKRKEERKCKLKNLN